MCGVALCGVLAMTKSTYFRFPKWSECCPCEPEPPPPVGQCSDCTDAVPQQWLLTITGFQDSGVCPPGTCPGLDGQYVLDQDNDCSWKYDPGPAPGACEMGNILFDLIENGGVIQVALSLVIGASSWDASWPSTTPDNCNQTYGPVTLFWDAGSFTENCDSLNPPTVTVAPI